MQKEVNIRGMTGIDEREEARESEAECGYEDAGTDMIRTEGQVSNLQGKGMIKR